MIDMTTTDAGIRQLHARFIDAVWRKDADAFAACFSATGDWKIAGLHLHGRSEIRETFGKLLGVCDRVMLVHGTPILDVVDGHVTGRLHVTEFAKMADGSAAMTMGVYYDRYVEESDRWRFEWRHFSLHYRGPSDLSADLVASPDYGPPPAMPGGDEPTLTRRKG